MARTPLLPRGDDLRTWAQAITQRVERDYAFLRPKTGSISLSSTISNVITDINVLPTSYIVMLATSANAMSTVASGLYISSKSQGEFTITTAAPAGTGSTFDYVIMPPPDLA